MLGSMDQNLVPSNSDLKLFEDIDDIIVKSINTGDPSLAFGFGQGLITRSLVSGGPALAKLLFKLKENWNLFQAAGYEEEFEDVAYVHIGLKQDTVRKYVRMWESVFENPNIADDIKEKLIGRGVKQLLLLTAAAREGLGRDVLEKIADAPDEREVRDIIRAERGERTSSGTARRIQIQVSTSDRFRKGTLLVRKGSTVETIGRLDIDSDNELVNHSVTGIINGMGIQEV